MSPHQDPYRYFGPSSSFSEGSSESPVAHQVRSPGQSWPPAAMIGDQSGYSQPHQSLDPVGNSLEVYDAEDMNYPSNYPGPSSSLPSTSFQDPGVGTDATHATYANDHLPFHHFDNLPFYPYPESHYTHSQHQHVFTPYDPGYYPTQALVHDVHQHPAHDIHTSQTTQGPSAPVYLHSSSTQLLNPSYGGPVYGTDTRAARLTSDSLMLDGANTAGTGAGGGQHSHPSPVATSPSNQTSAPSPSRPPPSSPERKRLLPLPAADELPTARRVVRRHDRAMGVHSTSSDYPRHSRGNSVVYGRGPLIPQERYTTSTISSFNVPDQHPITFNLENPDQTGIPIIDILNKTDGFARIRDRTQTFSHMGKKTFTLRVQWPGYKPRSKTIAAMDWKKMRGPITRVKLSEAVATAIRDLFEKYHDERYDPDYAEWNVGPNGIQLDQVCLVELHHVSRGSWQPQLCLLGTHH